MFEASHYPRILVVDDDSFARMFVARRLARLNAMILEAADGAEAIHILREHEVDLVFLDLDMPGVNGFAMLGLIRGQPKLRHLPVVVLTAKQDRGSLEAALRAGATSFLVKPLDWSAFGEHIRHLIELIRSARAFEAADRQSPLRVNAH